MKIDNLLMFGLLVAGLLIANRMAAAAPVARDNRMPTVGQDGSIWTADKQFFYDGEFWYQLGQNGYRLIDGQP